MSNALAIAAVTATIRGLIAREGITVTSQSPERAGLDAAGGDRINVFLYHTMPNAHWRNSEIPSQTRSGETGHPPLALNLYYLLTAYGADNSDLSAHHILGRAMRVLHDRPVLLPEDIRNVTQGETLLSDADLDQQLERVRISPDSLSLEDLSRLWTTFQTHYRVSAAYQASVVLIESQRPTKAPLPVLKRGAEDQGVNTSVGIGPILERIEYRENISQPAFPAANIAESDSAEVIRILGSGIPPGELNVIVRDPKHENHEPDQDIVAEFATKRTSENELVLALDRAKPWFAGMLTAELRYARTDGSLATTNALPLAIAPQHRFGTEAPIKVLTSRTPENGQVFLDVACRFPLGERRRAYLILTGNKSYQIAQQRDEIGTGQLTPRFDISDVQPGTYWLRLRVDGVDSVLMTRSGSPPSLAFDKRFEVEL
jgi:hypothetical protein